MAPAEKREDVMFTVMAEVPSDEKSRMRVTGEAIDGVRLLAIGDPPDVEHGSVCAVERDVELSLSTESMPSVPSRL
jgi:hypothetical protein